MPRDNSFFSIHKAFTELFDHEPEISLSFEHKMFHVEGSNYGEDYLTEDYSVKTYSFSCDPFIQNGLKEDDFHPEIIWELYDKIKEILKH